MLPVQLRIMFNKKGFQISFTIMMLLSLFGVLYSIYKPHAYVLTEGCDLSFVKAIDESIMNEFSPVNKILRFIFPFVAVLPFAFSVYNDRSTRIFELQLSRSSVKKYYFSKLATALIGGFLIFFIPLLINSLLNNLFFADSVIDIFHPDYSKMSLGENTYITDNDFMVSLAAWSPRLCELFSITLISLFGGACSMLAFSVSLFIRKIAVLIFIPAFVFVYALDTVESMILSKFGYYYFKLNPLNYSIISSDNMIPGRAYWIPFAMIALLVILSSLMTYIYSRKDQLL